MLDLGFLRSSKTRRGLALCAVALAAGGLVLVRAPAVASPVGMDQWLVPGSSAGVTQFSQNGVHGTITLSQSSVLAQREGTVYADIKLTADASRATEQRAPLSLAVVLDTSGSMSGVKIEDAKRSILRLMADMRDDDQIALVRYAHSAEVVQPLTRLGEVRRSLESKVRNIAAEGGTNIPAGLRLGRGALASAGLGRVKRIVLVSDGLDSGRSEASTLASDAAEHGMTVSSLGIGTDFDESYMSAVSREGHGNFAFVTEGQSEGLATFLRKELHETASTVAESMHVRLQLPVGVRFVRALGADAKLISGDMLDISAGALFAGDERRVTLELATLLPAGSQAPLGVHASWQPIGGAVVEVGAEALLLRAVGNEAQALATRNLEAFARATSAIASQSQMEAAEAYARGDTERANRLIGENVALLEAAAVAAPSAAPALRKQVDAYKGDLSGFTEDSASLGGKTAAKKAMAREYGNASRTVTY